MHPRYRRKGIGYNLNRYVISELTRLGFKVYRVAILAWNKPSINLARKLGFEEVARWVSLETKIESLLDAKECECREISNPDTIWDKVSNSEMFRIAQGLIPIRWQWIRLNKRILAELMRNNRIRAIICRENLTALIPPNGEHYLPVGFINAEKFEDLQILASYLEKEKNTRPNTTIGFVFPKNYPFLSVLAQKDIFEIDETLVMELNTQ